jgi:hypothetical protein
MNPVIYQNNEFIIANQPCLISNEQLQNRQLIYIHNDFSLYYFNFQTNKYLPIQDINLFQKIIPLIFKFVSGRITKAIKEDRTPILIQFNKSKKTFKDIRNGTEYGKNQNLMNLMNIINPELLSNSKSKSNSKSEISFAAAISTAPQTNLDIKSAQEFHNLMATEIHGVSDPTIFFKCLMTLLLGLYKAVNKENIINLISNTINIRNELIKITNNPKDDLRYHQYFDEIRNQLKIAIASEIAIDASNRVLYLELDKYDYVCFDNLLIGLINGINNDAGFLGSLYDQSFKYFSKGKSSTKSENTELTPDCIAELMAKLMNSEIKNAFSKRRYD